MSLLWDKLDAIIKDVVRVIWIVVNLVNQLLTIDFKNELR